jgi:uncharacterized protein (DUF983 family)
MISVSIIFIHHFAIVELHYNFNTWEMIVKTILFVVMILNSHVAMAVEKQA